ncbi:hypothetical protein BRARA_I03067 [Brassica rapa]|uniref:F-box associated beta-propeller type 3 domain-containing protein n=1 Tax=Brassica campestris TaxID=3711 RepID=A0A397XYE7_BRACM|nr:hypothetical protein BRARA_I03067 [Brassica rapa]
MVSDDIPTELNLKILSRLPAKSIARFRNLFLTNSSLSHPRLIFAIKENGVWSIFSLSQHLTPYEKPSSSLVVTPEFHMKFPPDDIMWTDKKVPVICNPNTGRYETLPSYISRYRRVMTLGTRGMRWRKIHCSLRLDNLSKGVCINGVLYYLGDTSECKEKIREKSSFAIAFFDIRSEKFKFLYPERFCVIYYDDLTDDAVDLRVWVLEDVDKQEWSKYSLHF